MVLGILLDLAQAEPFTSKKAFRLQRSRPMHSAECSRTCVLQIVIEISERLTRSLIRRKMVSPGRNRDAQSRTSLETEQDRFADEAG
jgi:hypothetical protein